jgi:hypothetical protein
MTSGFVEDATACRRLTLWIRVFLQAALAHARTPMQMMAAKQQLMAAKNRQDVERLQFNCFN